MARELRFRSSVGATYVGVAALLAMALAASQSRGINPVALLLLGLALGLAVWVLTATHYTVHEDRLVVRCGPTRRCVEARLVERVRPTRTLLAAPALSMNRLEISGGFGSVVVSPKDRAGFVRALRRVAPQAEFEPGDDCTIR